MANRFQNNQHRLAYGLIASRDGLKCIQCGRKPPKVALEIDHADANPNNWDSENLHLMCKRDNLAKRQMLTNPRHTVSAVKRLIGRKYVSQEVARARENLPYEIVEAANGDVRIRIRERDFSPRRSRP